MPEMLYIGLLATSPAHQGKGYGSALVKTVTDMVGQFQSLNIADQLIYIFCGYGGG